MSSWEDLYKKESETIILERGTYPSRLDDPAKKFFSILSFCF